jgi:hypothetical protein
MEPLYPLTEERIRPFCGNIVCVLMQDGTRHVGVLSSCGKGRVILNGELPGSGKLYVNQSSGGGTSTLAAGSKKRGRKARKSAPTAQTLAYPFGYAGPGFYPGFYPRHPFGGELALDLALIALLFLIL